MPAFTLFDTGVTHSFVSPRLTCECTFKGSFNVKIAGVETAGEERMMTKRRYDGVSVIIEGMNRDLLELELGRCEVILGMYWLARHGAVVNCAKACVQFPREGGQIVDKGIKTGNEDRDQSIRHIYGLGQRCYQEGQRGLFSHHRNGEGD